MWKNETCTIHFIFDFNRLLDAGSNQLCNAIHATILLSSSAWERIIGRNPHGTNSLCWKSCQLIDLQLWRRKVFYYFDPSNNWHLSWMPWSIKWADSSKIATHCWACTLHEILPFLHCRHTFVTVPFFQDKILYTLPLPSP